jgi:hypothetical protein
MNAVEHNFDVFALINPWPQTPISLAVNLDGGVSRGSEPTILDQQTRATDPCVPTHLLVDGDLDVGAFRELNAANRFGVFVRKGFLTQEMLASSRRLFDDGKLFHWVYGYVDYFDIGVAQKVINAAIDLSDSVLLGSSLRLFTISVSDAHNFESGLFVSGQMCVIDDPSGTDNSDAVVHALRQLWFVVELRENIRYF